jgi:hypothetical protein
MLKVPSVLSTELVLRSLGIVIGNYYLWILLLLLASIRASARASRLSHWIEVGLRVRQVRQDVLGLLRNQRRLDRLVEFWKPVLVRSSS